MLPSIETIRYITNAEFPAILATPRLWYMRVSGQGLIVNGFWGSSAVFDANPCSALLPNSIEL